MSNTLVGGFILFENLILWPPHVLEQCSVCWECQKHFDTIQRVTSLNILMFSINNLHVQVFKSHVYLSSSSATLIIIIQSHSENT